MKCGSTLRHLGVVILQRSIVLEDGVSEEARALATACAVSEEDLAEIDAISRREGDEATALRTMSLFSGYSVGERNKDWVGPPVKASNPQLAFDLALRADDRRGAWIALNSSGWQASAASRALLKLKRTSRDAHFERLADLWSTRFGERPGSY